MVDPTANPQPKHPCRMSRWISSINMRLWKWSGTRGYGIPHHFLQGMAYKLGSGAVTLLILWWETRR